MAFVAFQFNLEFIVDNGNAKYIQVSDLGGVYVARSPSFIFKFSSVNIYWVAFSYD